MSSLSLSLPKAIPGFEGVNRYWDPRMNTPAAKILPGECYVSQQGEMIVTVLGSCIAACIRDKVLGVGGMNHFMLPVQSISASGSSVNMLSSDLCYGNWAMEFLINEILKLGGKREHLEVKVFGGGRVMSGFKNINIGERNSTFILDYLDKDGLLISSKDLGGDFPRKVLYFPDTGAVKLRRLKSLNNKTIENRERKYIDELRCTSKVGGIELF